MQNVELNNGITMPQLGFGVWQVSNEEVVPAVKKALEVGYRSIDTARIYNNEEGVGRAIAESGIPREELFITTKLWNADQGYDKALKAFDESLERLGLEYVDLYLIHWPCPDFGLYVETYKALEKIYQEGRAKAIGVSNFDIDHLEKILDECDVVPAVNQVECHPYLQQQELKEFCAKHHIKVEAYSPLMNGRDVLEDETIVNIAREHGKTPAQVILRWHLQNDTIVIPKSVTPSRIEENFRVFDFELSVEDMEAINTLDRNIRINAVPAEYHRK